MTNYLSEHLHNFTWLDHEGCPGLTIMVALYSTGTSPLIFVMKELFEGEGFAFIAAKYR